MEEGAPKEEKGSQDEEEDRHTGDFGVASCQARPAPSASPRIKSVVVLYVRLLYQNKIKRDKQNKASVFLKGPPLSK